MHPPSSTLFRQTLSRFATGVSILTSNNNGTCLGVTINSLASVSLDPPLVLFSLKKSSPRYTFFKECKSYAISVLSESQKFLSNHFARQGDANWQDFDLLKNEPSPLFQEALAHLKGHPEAFYEGGDHTIFLVRVTHMAFNENQKPLLFYKSDYHTLEEEKLPLENAL